MADTVSSVTAERFASGFTYGEYIAQINVNKDRFEQFYEMAEISEDDTKFFKEAVNATNGSAKMLVLGEDWCPDVYRGMPAMARLAEASGMEIRIFPRDQHLDIMDEFLKDGEFRSIPVVVFYTSEQKYLAHWIERPASANAERDEIDATVKAEMVGSEDEEIRSVIRERTRARQGAWQQASVQEIRELLADKLGIK